jgi:FAD/FMN-containing dehydrogenase
MACSRLLAVELVTAEGRRIRADRSQNAELFRAMQGGGGAFGVVTAMEFELLEVGPIQAGILFFPIDRAPEVLEAWRRWSPGLPDTVATVGRFMRIPPMPEIPEPLRGREFVVVEAAILGTPEEAHMYLEPIRALGAEIDTVVPTAPQDLQYLHMDPPHPIPGIGDHLTIDDLTADAVTAFIDAAGADSGSTLLMAEMILAGGKGFPAGYLVFGAGLAGSPEQKAATRADLRKFVEALNPYAAHRQYLNFSEHPTDPAKLWDAETLERLRAVKAGVDPEGVMVSNHPIG